MHDAISRSSDASDVPLSPRTLEVADLAARGWSNKAIAYELDIDVSTVSFHMVAIARKLGICSRVLLVRVLNERYFSGTCARAEASRFDAVLTRAERSVVALALEGKTNAEIARTRGRSERTIANQLACAFRKLGIGSRAELAARERA
jgi:DNA-binding NarL/FixJ family response regulator